MSRRALIAAAALAAAPLHQAQAGSLGETAAAPAPDAEIQRTIDAVYAAISGPAGQPRDWETFRRVFAENARLFAIGPDGPRGGSVDDYIARSEAALVRYGFTERELVNRIEQYGNLAQVWSSYSASLSRDGKPETLRGINSFQLSRAADGTWRVHSLLWQQETDAFPLPDNMSRSTH